jgi:hypothetical protein
MVGKASVSPGVSGSFTDSPNSSSWSWASGPPVHVTTAVRSVIWPPSPSSIGGSIGSVVRAMVQPLTTCGVTLVMPSGICTSSLVVPASPHPWGTCRANVK